VSLITKYAMRGMVRYSVSLNDSRITIYRWHDKGYESMDFSATVEDFNQFDETRPEEWFDVAAKMIQGRL